MSQLKANQPAEKKSSNLKKISACHGSDLFSRVNKTPAMRETFTLRPLVGGDGFSAGVDKDRDH